MRTTFALLAGHDRVVLTRRQAYGDLLLGVVCLLIAIAIQVTEIDSVEANVGPDVVSVLLTVAAVGPLVVRRRAPLLVLVACFPGFLGLIATKHAVGAATLGVIISFYTVVAWGSRSNAHRGVVVLGAGLAIAVALRPIDLSVEGLIVQLGLFAGSWVIGNGTRERRELHLLEVAEANSRAERERERAELERERAIRATVEERLRITRELHDVLGHAFSVMVVQAGVVEHLLEQQPVVAREALAQIGSTGRSSLAEMRRLLGVLRDGDAAAPPREPAPTLADLPALIARVKAAGLPVELKVEGTSEPLSAGLELAAYRVIQEALTNCLKHANASRAWVVLRHDPEALRLEVRDNGSAGVAPHGSPESNGSNGSNGSNESTGHGLAGMTERVAIYGGELSTGPATGGGYLVRALLPVQPSGSVHDAAAGGTA